MNYSLFGKTPQNGAGKFFKMIMNQSTYRNTIFKKIIEYIPVHYPCAWSGCTKAGDLRCTTCPDVLFYCSKKCQELHWHSRGSNILAYKNILCSNVDRHELPKVNPLRKNFYHGERRDTEPDVLERTMHAVSSSVRKSLPSIPMLNQ